MGQPEFSAKVIPIAQEDECISQELKVLDKTFKVTAVSMGNPHCVIEVDDLSDDLVNKYGPAIEVHEFFPEKTNVEFVSLKDEGRAEIRVWERGVGETLACGTGICGVFAALRRLNKVSDKLEVLAPGGSFSVEWRDGIYLSGPAEVVFEGRIDTESLDV